MLNFQGLESEAFDCTWRGRPAREGGASEEGLSPKTSEVPRSVDPYILGTSVVSETLMQSKQVTQRGSAAGYSVTGPRGVTC